jgi:DNA-binding Lrp family transcriptional regulator
MEIKPIHWNQKKWCMLKMVDKYKIIKKKRKDGVIQRYRVKVNNSKTKYINLNLTLGKDFIIRKSEYSKINRKDKNVYALIDKADKDITKRGYNSTFLKLVKKNPIYYCYLKLFDYIEDEVYFHGKDKIIPTFILNIPKIHFQNLIKTDFIQINKNGLLIIDPYLNDGVYIGLVEHYGFKSYEQYCNFVKKLIRKFNGMSKITYKGKLPPFSKSYDSNNYFESQWILKWRDIPK